MYLSIFKWLYTYILKSVGSLGIGAAASYGGGAKGSVKGKIENFNLIKDN